MSDKLYIQDLINLLSEKQNISKKEAELFLKTFFSLIEEGLDKDKSVKIKGLGTFKLIRVDSRESVDVNTGKRCIIEGHTKVSFNPDTTVKEFINKPFSHFETVILHDNVFFDEEKEKNVSGQEEISESEQVQKQEVVVENNALVEREPEELKEQSTENEEEKVSEDLESNEDSVVMVADPEEESVPKTHREEIKNQSVSYEKVLSTEDRLSEPSESLEKDAQEYIDSKEISEEDHPGDSLGLEDVETSSIPTKESLRLEESIPVTQEEVQDNEVMKEDELLTDKKRNNGVAYAVITCLTLFIITCLIYFIFNPHIFGKLFNSTDDVDDQTLIENYIPVEEDKNLIEEIVAEIDQEQPERNLEEEHAIIHNEERMDVGEEVTQTPPEDILSDTTKTIITGVRKGYDNVKADSTSYRIVGTMAVHTIRGGETLTKVSNTYYGTKDLWPYLVMHNRKVIKNPDNVPSGITIRIPALRDK